MRRVCAADSPRFRWALAAGIALLCPAAALATLGAHVSSVEADRAHLSASTTVQAAGPATVHILKSPNSAVVREFSDADGTVFAVSWKGPGRPDLRQLLGDDRFSAMASERHPGQRHMRRALAVKRSNLVILSQGHPGAFFGVAYDPALVPAGFSLDALR